MLSANNVSYYNCKDATQYLEFLSLKNRVAWIQSSH